MEFIDSNNKEAYENVVHSLNKLKLNGIVLTNYLQDRLTSPLGYLAIGDFSIDQYYKDDLNIKLNYYLNDGN